MLYTYFTPRRLLHWLCIFPIRASMQHILCPVVQKHRYGPAKSLHRKIFAIHPSIFLNRFRAGIPHISLLARNIKKVFIQASRDEIHILTYSQPPINLLLLGLIPTFSRDTCTFITSLNSLNLSTVSLAKQFSFSLVLCCLLLCLLLSTIQSLLFHSCLASACNSGLKPPRL